MKAYYDARAPEYDDWWLGTGRFADRVRPGWAEDVERLVRFVGSLPPARVLDVACGTGFLTRHHRGRVTAIDQSESMLAIAAERLPGAQLVRCDVLADGLPLGDASFDRVFTSFFYGHLEPTEREWFVAEARRVGRELVVVDSAVQDGIEPEGIQERMLGDGSRWTVLKRYFTGAGLAEELGRGEVLHESRRFVVVRA